MEFKKFSFIARQPVSRIVGKLTLRTLSVPFGDFWLARRDVVVQRIGISKNSSSFLSYGQVFRGPRVCVFV